MAEMGRYCKAYPLVRFRAFPDWSERPRNAGTETQTGGAKATQLPYQLTDDSMLYLQENLSVTYGIYKDEQVVFDQISPQWEEFCRSELKFEVPDFARNDAPDAPIAEP